MIKLSNDKVWVTVNKFGVHSRHVNRCFLFHYAMFCLANVNQYTLPVYFYGIWKVSFSLRAVGFGSLVNIRDTINLEISEHAFLSRLSLIHYHCVSCHSSSVF